MLIFRRSNRGQTTACTWLLSLSRLVSTMVHAGEPRYRRRSTSSDSYSRDLATLLESKWLSDFLHLFFLTSIPYQQRHQGVRIQCRTPLHFLAPRASRPLSREYVCHRSLATFSASDNRTCDQSIITLLTINLSPQYHIARLRNTGTCSTRKSLHHCRPY